MATGDALATHRFGVELGGIRVESIKEVSGLTVEQDVVEIAQTSPTGKPIIKKQPGVSKGGELTITRGMDPSRAFTEWLKSTVFDGNVETARKHLTISIMTTQGTSQRKINLYDAWVSKWEGPNLSAGQSAAAEEKVTIVFERIEVE